ncbi:nitrogen regulation protein NR(II) [Salinibius halmophilus]|uniref:nitrogen regulation protein NR(II) n=1 Tax=Salinibius halmophilus TaxID=1853216 RepID=UPI0022790E6C|nr:nitrogen regulation protein NR(II) [Salinibius halmophilus]
MSTELQAVFDHLTSAVLVLDEHLMVQRINGAGELMFAISSSRAAGEPFASLVEFDHRLERLISQALNEQRSITLRQTELQLRNHQVLVVDISVSPLQLNQQQTVMLELHSVDRLLRIAREEEVLAKQATSRHLIRGIAHEVKNPLGGIRGAAQLLAAELDRPELNEYTDIVIAEADRLRNLVDRMLGSNTLLNLQPTNVHSVLERVRQLLTVESRGAISFSRDYDPSLPDVQADAEQLIQALLNIARNAMQALLEAQTEAPVITFRTRVVRQFTIGAVRHRLVAQVDVLDNGPGIPEELVENIFFPMISGRAEGTGLGLSIAQNIAAQHQGIIECANGPLTRFTLYLPIEVR